MRRVELKCDMVHSDTVSIIMPNFNKGTFAVEAVKSVLKQSHPHIELIFVDDHSTDGSEAAVAEIARTEPRIKVLKTALPQSGGGSARNLGLNYASGNYVVFLDSDDWMDADCITERLEAFTEHQECDFLVFQMGIFFDSPGDSNLVVNCMKDRSDLERFFLRDQPWLISGPIWKRLFLQTLGGFDPSLISQQDADLHIRAIVESEKYHHFYSRPKVFYRQNVESIPRTKSQSYVCIHQRSLMLQKHLSLLKKAGMLTDEIGNAIAQYLLDLAQMLRWHKSASKKHTLAEAFAMWSVAFDQRLVSDELYRIGMGYIKFKHNMLWNRFPSWMQKRERYFQKELDQLIFKPSETLSNTLLDDSFR